MTGEGDVAPPAVEVLDQDDGSELRVGPVAQGVARLVDVRIWRNGPSGLTPARTGLLLDEADMYALHHGLAELIEASDAGRRVARVVWDGSATRRLRAETEPFGTRHLAHLGFWQRVRNSWRPADDGLVFQADRLLQLQNALGHFRLWMRAQPSGSAVAALLPADNLLDSWPASGADWLTLEPTRVAFHPRGTRITCMISEKDDRHWLVVRQWHRDDSLWLPAESSVDLSMVDLDAVLTSLRRIGDQLSEGRTPEPEHSICLNGAEVRIWMASNAGKSTLCLEQYRADTEEPAGIVSFGAEELPRFGRALVQGWYLLAGWLSDAERLELRRAAQAQPSVAPVPPVDETVVADEHALDQETIEVPGIIDSQESLAQSPGEPPVLSFAAESATPGVLIPVNGAVRIQVEGHTGPGSVTLPDEVAAGILAGLVELDYARNSESRRDPVLLFERSDCAVFGRLGTQASSDSVELRAWIEPAESEAIDFAAVCLPELIGCLRQYLELVGVAEPVVPDSRLLHPPGAIVDTAHPSHLRPLAAGLPLDGPARGYETISTDIANRPLGTISLGASDVSLSVYGRSESPVLSVTWEGGSMDLAISHLEQLLGSLRQLYYDALRGRRGQSVTVCQYPVVTVSVENRNGDLSAVLRQETDGELTTLWFPARHVPTFLDAAETALSLT